MKDVIRFLLAFILIPTTTLAMMSVLVFLIAAPFELIDSNTIHLIEYFPTFVISLLISIGGTKCLIVLLSP